MPRMPRARASGLLARLLLGWCDGRKTSNDAHTLSLPSWHSPLYPPSGPPFTACREAAPLPLRCSPTPRELAYFRKQICRLELYKGKLCRGQVASAKRGKNWWRLDGLTWERACLDLPRKHTTFTSAPAQLWLVAAQNDRTLVQMRLICSHCTCATATTMTNRQKLCWSMMGICM